MTTSRAVLVLSGLCIVALAISAQASEQAKPTSSDGTNFCQGCRSLVSFVANFNISSQREHNKHMFNDYFKDQFATRHIPDASLNAINFYVNGIYFLLDRIDPVLHCDQIGACGPVATPTGLIDATLTPGATNEVCATCEHLVDTVKQMLLDPNAVDDLRTKLGAFCSALKVIKEEDQCNQLVDKYLEQALNFLRDLKPVDYCRAIQLCTVEKAINQPAGPDGLSSAKAVLPTLADFNRFGIETNVAIDGREVIALARHLSPTCMLCKTIMGELFKILRDNRTEANIKYALGQVCKLIYPRNDDKQDQCDQLVSAYTRELIELLTEETDPNLLCILLEQCTYQLPNSKLTGKYRLEQAEPAPSSNAPVAAPSLGKFIAMLDSSKPENSIEACLECRMFIQVIQEEVKKPQSREQIKHFLLTKLCANLPDPELKNACNQMVDAYADIFFKAVAQELDPKKACIELGVCKRQLANLGLLIGSSLDNNPFDQSTIPAIQMPSLRPISAQKGQLCDDCQAVVNQIDEHMSRHPIGRDLSNLINQACPRSANQAMCRSMLDTNGHEIVRDLTNLAKNSRQICKAYYNC